MAKHGSPLSEAVTSSFPHRQKPRSVGKQDINSTEGVSSSMDYPNIAEGTF